MKLEVTFQQKKGGKKYTRTAKSKLGYWVGDEPPAIQLSSGIVNLDVRYLKSQDPDSDEARIGVCWCYGRQRKAAWFVFQRKENRRFELCCKPQTGEYGGEPVETEWVVSVHEIPEKKRRAA